MDLGASDADERPAKSATAFRTISEVADELDVAQHVLRFWESKFPQVKPLKRGGGRRYYRPEDVSLLRDIQSLLYKEGYTIKGAQKLLRQKKTASAKSPPPEPPPAHSQLEIAQIVPEATAGDEKRARLIQMREELVALRTKLSDLIEEAV